MYLESQQNWMKSRTDSQVLLEKKWSRKLKPSTSWCSIFKILADRLRSKIFYFNISQVNLLWVVGIFLYHSSYYIFYSSLRCNPSKKDFSYYVITQKLCKPVWIIWIFLINLSNHKREQSILQCFFFS